MEQSLSTPPGCVRGVDTVRLRALRVQGGLPRIVQVTSLPGKVYIAGTEGHQGSAPQKHLLQEDLVEDFLRNQGLLVQTMPANGELLF